MAKNIVIETEVTWDLIDAIGDEKIMHEAIKIPLIRKIFKNDLKKWGIPVELAMECLLEANVKIIIDLDNLRDMYRSGMYS